jgi:hypothetical protein
VDFGSIFKKGNAHWAIRTDGSAKSDIAGKLLGERSVTVAALGPPVEEVCAKRVLRVRE